MPRGISVLMILGFFLPWLRAEDVVHLKGEEQPLRCEIEAITDKILICRISVDLGGGQTGSSKRTLATAQVDFIEFAPLPGEIEILENPEAATGDALERLWNEKLRLLHRPRSNGGKIGLLFGNALLAADDRFSRQRAISVFEKIRELDWNTGNHAAAWKGIVQAQIRLGLLDEALAGAEKLAAETGDPELLIEARYAAARAEFEKLEALVEENPRWEEDDLVRPERNRLYHETIDRFLWPYLFHGTREESAARGLVAAAEVYRFGNEPDLARACLTDAVALYPDTSPAAEARKLLSQTNEESPNHEKETEPESN